MYKNQAIYAGYKTVELLVTRLQCHTCHRNKWAWGGTAAAVPPPFQACQPCPLWEPSHI